MDTNSKIRRQFFEQIVETLISTRQIADAVTVIDEMTQTFSLDGKILLYRVRIFDLNSDFANVIREGEMALEKHDTNEKDTMMLHNIVANAYDKLGAIDRAAAHYLASSQIDPRSIDDETLRAELTEDRREDYSNYLFALHRLSPSKITSQKIFSAIRRYDKLYVGVKRFRHKPHRHEKIRVGYVSPDFRAHVAGYFSAPFFINHDGDRFEVIGYAACDEDAFSAELKSHADGWRNIKGKSALDSARIIYDDELDILVDLSGHTAHNCLPIMAYKPTPIQISGIGWIGSTGLNAVDYFFVDKHTVTDYNGKKFFTEKVIQLPHTHFCYRRPNDAPEVSAAPCRVNGYITFGSFNNFSKVTDEQLRLWSEIMSAIPTARLFIKSTVFNSKFVEEIAIGRLRTASIAPDRVTVEGGSDYKNYLKAFGAVDVMLDSYPYVGGGTTCDALYMGVPVITRAGDRHGTRFGLSFLSNIRAAELCASTDEEYIAKAIELAGDVDRIEKYRRELRSMMECSPLMDAAAYMSDVEAAYIQLTE